MKILRFGIMLTLLIGFCGRVVAQQTAATSKPATETDSVLDSLEDKVFDLINTYRIKKGLNELVWVDAIHDEALQHSVNMAERKVPFSHIGFEERINRLKATLPNSVVAASENVAYGKLSAEQVVKGWLNSKGHKKNIEGKYEQTGIGIEMDSKGVLFFTQIFIK